MVEVWRIGNVVAGSRMMREWQEMGQVRMMGRTTGRIRESSGCRSIAEVYRKPVVGLGNEGIRLD